MKELDKSKKYRLNGDSDVYAHRNDDAFQWVGESEGLYFDTNQFEHLYNIGMVTEVEVDEQYLKSKEPK